MLVFSFNAGRPLVVRVAGTAAVASEAGALRRRAIADDAQSQGWRVNGGCRRESDDGMKSKSRQTKTEAKREGSVHLAPLRANFSAARVVPARSTATSTIVLVTRLQSLLSFGANVYKTDSYEHPSRWMNVFGSFGRALTTSIAVPARWVASSTFSRCFAASHANMAIRPTKASDAVALEAARNIHAPRDPNTLSNYNAWRTKHTTANFTIDFDAKRLLGTVQLELEKLADESKIVLDTRYRILETRLSRGTNHSSAT